MEYKLSFTDDRLRSGILDRLNRQFGEMDPNTLGQYADSAIEQIRREGNGALYDGLVRRGVKVALDVLERAKSNDS